MVNHMTEFFRLLFQRLSHRVVVLTRKLPLSLENLIVLGLLLIILITHITLRGVPFQSDESVYAYSGYAISHGSVPYSGIQLAQPPLMYLALGFLFTLFGPSFLLLTIAESTIVVFTGVLIFIVAKRLKFGGSNVIFPLLSVVIYSLITFDNFSTSFLEIFLTFFIMLCTAIYTLYVLKNGQRSKPALFLVGILLGVTLMIKYTSIVFVAALFLFNSITLIWKKAYKRTIIEGAILCFGAVIPFIISFALISYAWDSFRQFYLQTMYWQVVRSSTALSLRFFNIMVYVLKFFPLLILSGIGTFFLYRKAPKPQALLFPVIFVSNIIGLVSVFNTFLLHYLYYLSPFLALLSALGLAGVLDFVRNTPWSFRINKKVLARLFVFVTITWITIEVGAQAVMVRDYTDDSVHLEVGKYVSQITKPDDKIWTSEGAIAFFAQRLIVPSNSSDWPLHSSFADIFAYDFDNYIGGSMKDYRYGIVSPEEFVNSWETNEIKVIVIIRGSDWVPHPDKLLLSGFQNFTGASEYLQEKYLLDRTFTSTDRMHTHEIWLRK